MRHQVGGQRSQVERALIDDVITIRVLHACQFKGFVARGGLSGDPKVHYIHVQTDELGTVVLSPMTQGGDMILRRRTLVPVAPMQMGRNGGGVVGRHEDDMDLWQWLMR